MEPLPWLVMTYFCGLVSVTYYCFTLQMYTWPLLQTLFSEVLTRDEWLRLWDNVFSNHPGYLLLVITAYLTCSRHSLLQCAIVEDFEVGKHYFFLVKIKYVCTCCVYVLYSTTVENYGGYCCARTF